MTIDKQDLKLLEALGSKLYLFTKTSAQEHRAFDLFKQGLLDRRSEVYRMSAGRRTVEYRWAYRRTEAGTKIVHRKGLT
jgi:hypothetical protein